VGKHVKDVILWLLRRVRGAKGLVLFPEPLPARLDRLGVVRGHLYLIADCRLPIEEYAACCPASLGRSASGPNQNVIVVRILKTGKKELGSGGASTQIGNRQSAMPSGLKVLEHFLARHQALAAGFLDVQGLKQPTAEFALHLLDGTRGGARQRNVAPR